MRIVDELEKNGFLSTEIHKLGSRLWRRAQREQMRVVVFTSGSRGEGKSTTVAYLATAMGQHGSRRVVALDLDLRQPSLARYMQLETTGSLASVLRGECRVQSVIQKTTLPNLDIVCPSPQGDDPALLMRTREVLGLFADLRDSYDLVLVDVPALIPVPDASILLPLADGVILLAMAGRTTKHELTKARELCLGMEANIIGLVIGNMEESSPELGYYGYGYNYGYGGPGENGKKDQPGNGNGPPRG